MEQSDRGRAFHPRPGLLAPLGTIWTKPCQAVPHQDPRGHPVVSKGRCGLRVGGRRGTSGALRWTDGPGGRASQGLQLWHGSEAGRVWLGTCPGSQYSPSPQPPAKAPGRHRLPVPPGGGAPASLSRSQGSGGRQARGPSLSTGRGGTTAYKPSISSSEGWVSCFPDHQMHRSHTQECNCQDSRVSGPRRHV